ncbi:uncharacterized protein LOC135137240 [Zophobas morio]|uniref:uncharacterized protein LOC135137240 n=1 Tax=Zophobas morio TaxID=2755281 RepID=UPI003082A420
MIISKCRHLLTHDFCLKIYRGLTVKIFHLKAIKYVLLLLQISGYLLILVQTCMFFYKFDFDYFTQYGTFYTFLLYVLLVFKCLPYVLLDLVEFTEKEIDSWNVKDDVSPKVTEKITRDVHYGLSYLSFGVILSFMTGIMLAATTDIDDDFLYDKELITYLFKWKVTTVMVCLIRYFFCFVPYPTTISPCYQLIYWFIRVKLAIYIIIDRMERVNSGYENQQQSKLDEVYHKTVSERLKWIIDLHVKTCVLIRYIEGKTKVLMFPFKICATLALISFVACYFSLESKPIKEYILLSILFTNTLFTLFLLTSYGQYIEDLSQDIFDTSARVKWYHWNHSNKKNYLIYLTNAQKPFKFNYTENISVNYQLAVDAVRNLISALTFVVQIKIARGELV